MSGGAPTIQIPRWIQLVGLPILALIALLIVGKVFHAVFLFLVAALIALLLDPLVRSLERLRIPRGFSIAIVYLSFAAALVAVVIAVSVIVIDRTQSAANRIDNYLTTESGRTPADRIRARTSTVSRSGWTRTPGAGRHQEAGHRLRPEHQGQGRREVHDGRDRLPARRGDLDLPADLRARADPRGLDLHAPRHGPAEGGDRPALPAKPGRARADRSDRAGASPATCAGRCCSR